MRSESEITKELTALQAEYHEKSQTMPTKESAALGARVKALRVEISDFYSNGAKKCPSCGAAPMGMDRGKVYEVGCLNCPPHLVEAGGIPKRRSFSAQGRTPTQAVENWNAENFLLDGKIELIPLK